MYGIYRKKKTKYKQKKHLPPPPLVPPTRSHSSRPPHIVKRTTTLQLPYLTLLFIQLNTTMIILFIVLKGKNQYFWKSLSSFHKNQKEPYTMVKKIFFFLGQKSQFGVKLTKAIIFENKDGKKNLISDEELKTRTWMGMRVPYSPTLDMAQVIKHVISKIWSKWSNAFLIIWLKLYIFSSSFI